VQDGRALAAGIRERILERDPSWEGVSSLPASLAERFYVGHTHTARARKVGRASYDMIAPDTVHGEQERDLGEGVHIEPRICSS